LEFPFGNGAEEAAGFDPGFGECGVIDEIIFS
jgi:hypothetical protein